MKKVIAAWFISILFTLPSFSQEKFTPTLITLYPYEIVVDESLRQGVSDYDRETEVTDEIRKNYVKENLAENWKIIRNKELDFIQKQDYFSQLPFGISTNLIYKIFDYHNYPLVYPLKETSPATHAAMMAIAKKHQVDWVVNPVKVEILETQDGKTMIAHIKLYNVVTNRFFMDEVYTSSAENPGGTLECLEGSWQCVVNGIISQSIIDIFDRLEKNRRYWSYNE